MAPKLPDRRPAEHRHRSDSEGLAATYKISAELFAYIDILNVYELEDWRCEAPAWSANGQINRTMALEGSRIRYEFWNGQTSKKKKYSQHDGLVTTNHNPCLWTNVGVVCDDCANRSEREEGSCFASCKPWRGVHDSASRILDRWEQGELSDTCFLHHLRFVAYGLGKRDFQNSEVVWPGNLTTKHRPKLSVERENGSLCTIRFLMAEDSTDPTCGWTASREEGATFYWPL